MRKQNRISQKTIDIVVTHRDHDENIRQELDSVKSDIAHKLPSFSSSVDADITRGLTMSKRGQNTTMHVVFVAQTFRICAAKAGRGQSESGSL